MCCPAVRARTHSQIQRHRPEHSAIQYLKYIFLFFQNIILGSPHRVNAVSYDQGCFTKDIFALQIFFVILTLNRLIKHRIQQVVSLRHNNSILTKNYTTSFLIFVTEKKYYKWLVPGKLSKFKCDDTTSVIHFYWDIYGEKE